MDTRDKRRVPFIYQLLKDKASLTTKCAELCKYVEQVEAEAKQRHLRREAAIEEMAAARMQQWKAEFRARHRREGEKRAAAVKAECIAAFKPEVQRLLDQHADALAQQQQRHAVELEKARGAVPRKAAKLAKKHVAKLQRDLAQVSASKIASVRSQWAEDRRRHDAAEAALRAAWKTAEEAAAAKHAREQKALRNEYEAAAHDRAAAAAAAARVREQEQGIRTELQEQQQELSNQAFLRLERERLEEQLERRYREQYDRSLAAAEAGHAKEVKTLEERHALDAEVLRQRLHLHGAEEVQSLEERWGEESLALRRQLSEAELRGKHLQRELDLSRDTAARLTRDRTALREEVHALSEQAQRLKAERLQDKLNLKELDHEFQLELSQERTAHGKALHAKVDHLLRSHARKLDAVQEEKQRLEQDHAAELRRLQDSITATLSKQREHRKKLVAENEFLRGTVQRLESQIQMIAAEHRDDHAHRHL